MNIIKLISAALCIVIPASLEGQKITQSEFLGLIKSNHPLFKKEMLSSQIETHSRDSYLGSRDWVVSASPYYARQNIIPPQALSPESVDQMSIGFGVSKAYWNSGGRLSVGWNTDFQNQNGLETLTIPGVGDITGEPKYYQSNAVISYTQPLLQNFRGELDRMGYEIGNYSVRLAEVQAKENQEGFLLNLGTLYLEWVYIGEQKSITTGRLQLAKQQLDQIRKKRASNLVDEVDVLRAEDAVRITEQGIVLINAQYMGVQAEMATMARQPEINTSEPDFDLYQMVDLPSIDQAVEHLMSNSRVLRVIGLNQKQLQRQKQGLEEMAKSQLFLNTSVTVKKGGLEFSESLGFDKTDFGLALSFSKPLGNTAALKQVQKNEVQSMQLAEARSEVVLQLEAGLRNLMIQMGEIKKALELNKLQIESAKLKTEKELERYNQGRGDLAFVIQSQDNEEQARLNYAQNAVTYQTLYLQYQAIMDELLPDDSSETEG